MKIKTKKGAFFVTLLLSVMMVLIIALTINFMGVRRFFVYPGTHGMVQAVFFLVTICLFVVGFNLALFAAYDRWKKHPNVDQLTGIGTFSKLSKDVAQMLQKNSNAPFVYVHFNVDQFKFLNETFGFCVGDDFLKHVASMLKKHFEGSAYARIEADKFAVLFEAASETEAVNRLKALSKDICAFQNNLNKPCDITISYGLYQMQQKSLPLRSIDDKLRVTIRTFKNVKENTYIFYNEKSISEWEWQHHLESKMRFALHHGQFVVYLQPKYNMKTLCVSGAEALVRWQYQDQVLLSPKEFIPLFEKNGFISTLDMHVVEQVCRKMKEWIDKGYRLMPVSINISRRNFLVENFCESFLEVINKYNIPKHLIEIEVTESAFMEDMDVVMACINQFKSYGFSISLDDFGTGYACLHAMNSLPIDILKIDQSLLTCNKDQTSNSVFASVLDMAKKLGIQTIAEGIETKGQLDFIQKTECDMIQGYLLAEPMNCDAFEAMLLASG